MQHFVLIMMNDEPPWSNCYAKLTICVCVFNFICHSNKSWIIVIIFSIPFSPNFSISLISSTYSAGVGRGTRKHNAHSEA